jgi:hypothetical protein
MQDDAHAEEGSAQKQGMMRSAPASEAGRCDIHTANICRPLAQIWAPPLYWGIWKLSLRVSVWLRDDTRSEEW